MKKFNFLFLAAIICAACIFQCESLYAAEKSRTSLQTDLSTYKLNTYNPGVNYDRLTDITDSQFNVLSDGIGSFKICGDADTVNNNTVYYGADLTLAANHQLNCDIDATGNTTEATVDIPVFTNKAFDVLGMTCRNEQDANADITYTLRTAEGATVPSVTCTIADGERDCVADIQTTTQIAAGATVSIGASSTSDVGAANGFICEIHTLF